MTEFGVVEFQNIRALSKSITTGESIKGGRIRVEQLQRTLQIEDSIELP
jgi:hypothetical protein